MAPTHTHSLHTPTHLFDLSQLLSAPAHIVIAHFVEGFLLVLSLDGFPLAVDHSVRGHNAMGAGVSLHNLGGDSYFRRLEWEGQSQLGGWGQF